MSKFFKRAGLIVAGLAVIGVIGFIAIQFVPVKEDNPPVVSEPAWDSSQTQALAERACYDCHSNQTKWPWYAHVAPASWLVAHDVDEGRAKLNFSEWNSNKSQAGENEGNEGDEAKEGKKGKGVDANEIAEEVEKGAMPPRKYLLMHPEARLSDAEIETLIAGLKATFGSGSEGAMLK